MPAGSHPKKPGNFLFPVLMVVCFVGILYTFREPIGNVTRSISLFQQNIVWNSDACPKGKDWHQFGSKCYKMVSYDPIYDFQGALDYCTKRNYRLLLPTSWGENQAIIGMFFKGVKDYNQNWIWIGLRRRKHGGTRDFYDVNKPLYRTEQIYFTNFDEARNEPNGTVNVEECVVMNRSQGKDVDLGKWWDLECDGRMYITVCETDATGVDYGEGIEQQTTSLPDVEAVEAT